DKTHVIYEDHIIQGADANTFREAAPDSNYYVDTNSVFYIDRRLDDVAAEHFEVLISAQGNSGYGVERKGIDNRVFFYGKLIEGADGASFQFTSNNQSLYVQDNNAVYYLDKVVPGAQPECFHAYPDFGEYGLNICDNALAVFYRGKPLNGANPKSFKLVDSDHKLFRDEDKAYIEGKEVFKGLDIGSIKMMDDNYIVDKNGAYIANTKTTVLIENADPKTFKTLGKGYAKDKNHVYHYNYSANAKVIKGADPKTFVVTRFNENVEYDAKDAQHQYRWGRRH
ncbi:MAG TPA: DKNYY domain-containing protein, partial [Cellvibrionaceae bacterium]